NKFMPEDNKYDLVKTELELTQRQMDKYDGLSVKIRTWTVTLWIGIMGWAFQVGKKETLLLGAFVVLIFWWLDAMNKNFREDYKQRRNKTAHGLKLYFQTSSWPENFFAPDLPLHSQRIAGSLKKFLKLHIALLYFPLIIRT
ncbi:hypothetical protein MYX06_05365, partial [Patescibacteria group bacterium AH-259-L05]|nr:hypothetical protein [Patescibacteria group bacterium AH-259-L05]